MDNIANPVPNAERASTAAAKPKLGRKRLNLDLAPAAHELLQRISDETGKSMTEVLRTGLALYGIAHDAEARGQALGVVDDDQVIKEILIP